MTASRTRIIIAGLLSAQCLVFEWAVLAHARFAVVPGGTKLVALLGGALYVLAIAFVAGWQPQWRLFGRLTVILALIFTVRYHIPWVVQWTSRGVASERAPELVAFLREMSAAQEQYRLRHASYAGSIDSLSDWTTTPAGTSVRVERHGDQGWSARAMRGSVQCAIWVRDSTLRTESSQPEGSPTCGQDDRRSHQIVRSVLATSTGEAGFSDEDVRGRWSQHRVNEMRSGITTGVHSTGGGVRWTTAISGELRASVAVAGNQVFVGAHGNGELVALSLDSGKIGFRIRVPNWVHHEPVVTPELIIVGMGNNEPPFRHGPESGSAPSGVAAYDRRTGRERWRRYTRGAVMASPVVRDSIVAVMTNGGEAVAWRVTDGAEIWRTAVSQSSPMSNPLLRDTVMFVGIEPAGLCALDVRTGRSLYCQEVTHNSWGGGHTSPTLAGDAVLLAFQAVSRPRFSRAWWPFALKSVVRIPEPLGGAPMLVSFDAATGSERWRVSLGPGIHEAVGHIAGTAVVDGGVAYLPVPTSGRVVAVVADSGRVIWSAAINPSRGSVLVTQGAVLAASADRGFFVLDAATGSVRCRQTLPATSDRAGLTLAGATGILTLRNGLVLARPIGDWLACRA